MDNTVVLITGATSGIGNAAVHKFIEEGHQVVATGRNQDSLDNLLKTVKNRDLLFTINADLTEENIPADLIKKVIALTGRLDTVINAAGIIDTGSIENTSLDDWRYMFKLNLDAIFEIMQKSLPYLEQSDLKSIVNISSVVSLRQFPGVLAYSVSKAAVDQLTKVSALELAEKGLIAVLH